MENAILDHVVVLVANLADGIAAYRRNGSSVVPGGDHAAGHTHNALVCFADGSYLELIAFKTPFKTDHRWDGWRTSPGVIDACFAFGSLDQTLPLLSESLKYDRVIQGGRTRPDGQRLQWKSAVSSAHGWLPFLIEDVMPRQLRVPDGEARRHPNGATGIASLEMSVRDPQFSAGQLSTLLGIGGVQTAGTSTKLGHVQFNFHASENTPGFVQLRAPGPFAITYTFA